VPDTSRSKRWYFVLGATLTLLLLVALLGGFSLRLRAELDLAEKRLSRVEINEVAENAAERTAEVATCYATARARPRLIRALSAIAGVIETDVGGRLALIQIIENYEARSPKLRECDQLAQKNKLDPRDFPEPRQGR
jgi:NAD-specific glutamate dehydrogenase